MRLVSWNVRGSWAAGRSLVKEQVEELRSARPDLIALQEVRGPRLEEWHSAFRGASSRLTEWHVVHTEREAAGRTNFLLIASRWPIAAVERSNRFEIPLFERVLAVTIDVDGHPLQLINTHVPD